VRAFALAAIAGSVAVACASASTSSSGLRGKVMRGPITPVCRINVPCEEPARGVKLFFSRSGKVVGRTTTNNKGWYRIALKPGAYSVTTNRPGFEHRPKPSRVTVRTDRVRRVDFSIDTGIR